MISLYLRTAFITYLTCFTVGTSTSDGPECEADKKKDWTYRRDLLNGPSHWKDSYPDCGGQQQSPINIITSKVLKPDTLQTLNLKNFDKPVSNIIIYNTGSYISFTAIDGVSRSATLDDVEYLLSTFHFHWGNRTNDKGSEHAIDGEKFPMEAHFVLPGSNGIVLEISTLFEVNDELNPALDNFLSAKPHYQYYGDTFQGEIQRNNSDPKKQGKIYLDDILDFNCPYYRYKGSLGTPPCSENSIWLICKTKKHVQESQLLQLYTLNTVKERKINKENDCTLTNVWRPLQNSNGRKVYG